MKGLDLGPLYPQFYEAEFLIVLAVISFLILISITAYALGINTNQIQSILTVYIAVVLTLVFSSSVTALYVGEVDTENQVVRIVLHKEYDKKTPSEVANDMFSLHTQIPNLWWFVDGANRGAVNECKSKYGESLDWQRSEDVSPESNFIIPVSFQKEHRVMLQNTYQLLTKHNLAIPNDYQKLIIVVTYSMGYRVQP